VDAIVTYIKDNDPDKENSNRNKFKVQTYYGRMYKLYCTIHLALTLTPSSLPLTFTYLNSKYTFLLSPSPCPLVPFGRTGLQISTITCGSMRYQQSWKGASVKTETLTEDIEPESQWNLENCILRAFKMGVNHFETARGYGTSEHQMGLAFKNLIAAGEFKRSDIIIQTKVNPKPTASEFRAEIDKSLEALQIDYIDLFSFHGLNKYSQYDLVFNELYEVALSLKTSGVIKHIGFSTHGPSDLIYKFIETDKFEYVNLHYHFFGSYTASGQLDGEANGRCVEKARELGMGVFCISPVDKGGALYYPSDVVSEATIGEGIGAVEFGVGWCLTKHDTLTIGVAREEDFDEPLFEASNTSPSKISAVVSTLTKKLEDTHGKDWISTCYKGLPHCFETPTGVSFTNIVYNYNLVNAFGMKYYAQQRENGNMTNRSKWDDSKTPDENRKDWGYVPGMSPLPDVDYSSYLSKCPPENVERIKHICANYASIIEGEGGVDFRAWKAYPER